MGYYINTINGVNLPAKGKIPFLLAVGAIPVDGNKWEEGLICIVDNGVFEAAGFCYSPAEFEAFKEPDRGPRQRTRNWLTHPDAAIWAGYIERKDN